MSVSATGLLQDQSESLEQDVAAGAGLAPAGDRLGDGGTDVAGELAGALMFVEAMPAP